MRSSAHSWSLRAVLAMTLGALPAPAHDVSPLSLTIPAGGTGTFTVSDAACRAVLSANSLDSTIATVSPSGTVTAFTQVYTVLGMRAGSTQVIASWSGVAPCVDTSSRAVSVTVTAPTGPVVLSPSIGNPGQTLPVSVVTPFLSDFGTVSFEPAGYLTASSLNDTSGALRFTLAIAANAPAGAYTFVYTPQGGGAPLRQPAAFQVVAIPPPPPPAGGSLQVAPDAIAQGTSGVRLTIAGSGFSAATGVTGAGDVRVDQVNFLSPQRLEVVVSNGADTPPGPRILLVTGPGAGQVLVTVVPATSIAAPVSVQTAAVVWPRPGMLLAPGDVVLARGILATTGTGVILGSWQLDGFPYERFAVTAAGGDPVTLESQVPIPVSSEGDHELRLVIDTPQRVGSESVRLVLVTRSEPELRLLEPAPGAASDAPLLFRWTLLPGAQAYVVGFRASAEDAEVVEARSADNEWRPTPDEWRALAGKSAWSVRPIFPGEVRGAPTPWRRLREAREARGGATGGAPDVVFASRALDAQAVPGVPPAPPRQPALPAASAPGDWRVDASAMATGVETSKENPAPSSAHLSVVSSGSWKGDGWSSDETVAMAGHQELEDPRRTLLDGRNFVARAGWQHGAWGVRGAASYSPPAANDQLQLLTTGLVRGGVEVAAATPAGRLSGYETFDSAAPGVASTVMGSEQRIRFAAYDAPLPSDRFALRAVLLDVDDAGTSDGLVPATRRRAWGALGRWTASPKLTLTLEAAHASADVNGGPGEAGNAFRLGLAGAFGAARYVVNLRRVEADYVNPANRGLAPASQDRTSGDVTVSRNFGGLAAALLYRYYESGRGTSMPRGRQHSGGLTLAMPLSAKASLGATGTVTQDRSDEGTTALGAIPAADRLQTGARVTANETLGGLALSESVGYMKLKDRRASSNDTGTTSATLGAAGAVAKGVSFAGTLSFTRLDAALAGRTDILLLFLQPSIVVLPDRLTLVPRAGWTRTESQPAATVTESEQYLANAQWMPWGSRGHAAIGATAEWDRNRSLLPGVPQGFLHRYSGTVAIRWGASSLREPFAPGVAGPLEPARELLAARAPVRPAL